MGGYSEQTGETVLSVKGFSELTNREVYEILQARSAVFVVEQKCVYQDLDGMDDLAIHVFLKRDNRLIAYLRVFEMDRAGRVARIGRVLTTERGTGMGRRILEAGMQAARERLNAEKIYIEAQSYAVKFYERAGFRQISDEFEEDGILHVRMIWEGKAYR